MCVPVFVLFTHMSVQCHVLCIYYVYILFRLYCLQTIQATHVYSSQILFQKPLFFTLGEFYYNRDKENAAMSIWFTCMLLAEYST